MANQGIFQYVCVRGFGFGGREGSGRVTDRKEVLYRHADTFWIATDLRCGPYLLHQTLILYQLASNSLN